MKRDFGGGFTAHVDALVVSFEIAGAAGALFQYDGGATTREGRDLGAEGAALAGEQRGRGFRGWDGIREAGKGRTRFGGRIGNGRNFRGGRRCLRRREVLGSFRYFRVVRIRRPV